MALFLQLWSSVDLAYTMAWRMQVREGRYSARKAVFLSLMCSGQSHGSPEKNIALE